MDCPFCNKENIAKQKIFETKTEYVLYNTRKSNKGRCLVVPKRHVSSVRGLNNNEAESLLKTVKYVSRKLNKYLKPQGINYGFNEGMIAGQEIDHFHFHLLPRFQNDRLPRFHIFHGNAKQKKNWSKKKFQSLVIEFRQLFQKSGCNLQG